MQLKGRYIMENKELNVFSFGGKDVRTIEIEGIPYFVGKDVTEDDIKAKYLNGTLTLDIPKKAEKEKAPKTIAIE